MSVALVTIGGVTVDNIVAADGTVALEQAGGNAVHSAVGARLWSDSVGIAGWIPGNYPLRWLERARAGGLAVDGIAVAADDAVTACEWFLYRDDGSRADNLHAPAGALAAAGFGMRLSRAEVQRWERTLREAPPAGRGYIAFRRDHQVAALPAAYRGARGVHLAPSAPFAQRALAAALDVRVTLDPSLATAALPRHELAALLARVHAFLPSEKELRRMLPDLPTPAALARLADLGPPVVAVKCGGAGALVWDRAAAAPVAVPAIATTVRDPTGAGDAWCGGFLASLLVDDDPVLAACRGTVSASFAVEGFGALHALDADPAAARQRLDSLLARIGRRPAS